MLELRVMRPEQTAQRRVALVQEPTTDPTIALACLVSTMGWTIIRGRESVTLLMPNARDPSEHRDAPDALAHLVYVCSWRKDRSRRSITSRRSRFP